MLGIELNRVSKSDTKSLKQRNTSFHTTKRYY